jgi:hypothetical protein
VLRSTSAAFGAGVLAAADLVAGLAPAGFFVCANPGVTTRMTAHTPASRNENTLRTFISNLLPQSLPRNDHRRWWIYGISTLVIVAAAASIEFAMGRVPWCRCGYIKLWHGVVKSSENSQQIADWYTFTHVIHGIGFYYLLWLVARRLPPGARFVIAVLLEAIWEVVENTPFVINRYRAATISLDYYGDSIINSMSDIAAMMLGFWIAQKLPVWLTLLLVIGVEVVLLFIIRDNLTLNILMLIHPFEAIKQWQLGG